MAMNSLRFPSWLRHCTETRFYVQKCEKHAGKYKTIYCGTCMGTLACEICWKVSTEHSGHEYLQVYTASKRTSVTIGDISRFCDASNIQLYQINFKQVVYLNPNEKGRVEIRDEAPKCGSCSRRLMESQYRFCSVACKMNSTGSQMNNTGSQMTSTGSQMNNTGSQMTSTESQMNNTGSLIRRTGSQMRSTGSQMRSTISQMRNKQLQMRSKGSQMKSTGSRRRTKGFSYRLRRRKARFPRRAAF